MILKRKLEKFVNEEMATISEKIKSEVENGEYPYEEFEKFFLLIRMSIKFNLFSKEVFRKLKEQIEKDLEKYGS